MLARSGMLLIQKNRPRWVGRKDRFFIRTIKFIEVPDQSFNNIAQVAFNLICPASKEPYTIILN